MANPSLRYTLTPPNVAAIEFNENGLRFGDGQDGFFLTRVLGLDGAPLRTPNDNAPQTHGGLIHDRYKGPRITTWEGRFYCQTVTTPNGVADMWEVMTETLKAAMEDLYDKDNPGTMSWVTRAGPTRSLQVLAQVPVETDVEAGANIAVAGIFSFGLISANPDPA